jgi:hypothetical protein
MSHVAVALSADSTKIYGFRNRIIVGYFKFTHLLKAPTKQITILQVIRVNF